MVVGHGLAHVVEGVMEGCDVAGRAPPGPVPKVLGRRGDGPVLVSPHGPDGLIAVAFDALGREGAAESIDERTAAVALVDNIELVDNKKKAEGRRR